MLKSASSCQRPLSHALTNALHMRHVTKSKVPGLTNIMEFFVKSYGTQHDPKHNAFKNSYRGSILERFSVGLLHTL